GLTTETAFDKQIVLTLSLPRNTVSIKLSNASTSFGIYPELSFSRINSSKMIVVTFGYAFDFSLCHVLDGIAQPINFPSHQTSLPFTLNSCSGNSCIMSLKLLVIFFNSGL